MLADVIDFKKASIAEEGTLDAVVLATKLAKVGYSVRIRRAVGGGMDCFKNLRHEFCYVAGQSDLSGVEYIVDPSFAENFVVSKPSFEYREVIKLIPREFVGTSETLIPLVELL